MIAMIVAMQIAPLAPPVPPERTPADVTKPTLRIDCTMREIDGRSGALRLAVSGGQGYWLPRQAPGARPVGRDAKATAQRVKVEHDSLGLFAGARLDQVNLSANGGDIPYQRSVSGVRSSYWRLALFASDDRSADDASLIAMVVDANANTGYAQGRCSLAATPQPPLDDAETQRYLVQ